MSREPTAIELLALGGFVGPYATGWLRDATGSYTWALLALAGAPVRAHRLRLTPLAVGTCLRHTDSLQEHRSGFYTEALRIRRIYDLLNGPLPVLFLFDELLSGTNSKDRRIAAV